MEDDTLFYDDGVERIMKLMKETFGDDFKAYYDDELPEIAEINLPCIMVKETTGNIAAGATGTDNVDEQVVVIIAMNLKDDIGASETDNLTGTKLRRIVKGQYPQGHAKAGQYHEKSVMYALRTNFTLDDAMIDNVIQTDMDIANRGDVYTKEAYVTINLRRLAIVPSRT